MVWGLPLSYNTAGLGLSIPRRALNRMSATLNGSDAGSKSVAVIGAGAAGLVAARELQKAHHRVTVFEQSDRCGGVWVYTDETETEDLTGQSRERQRVHGSMYSSLRTNLPRHIMAYTDVPFTLKATKSADDRLYCSHGEVPLKNFQDLQVLRYLEIFDKTFRISEITQYSTAVRELSPIARKKHGNKDVSLNEASQWPGWSVETENQVSKETKREEFDAVVVCNGHYSEPRIPNIPGTDSFPGVQLHTHNFRTNAGFRDKVVVIMGASASGQDISREIAEVAEKVYFSARPMKFGSKVIEWKSSDEAFGRRRNLVRRAAISELHADGRVSFTDGWQADNVDVVVYATGYHYSFPFLEMSGIVTVEDNRIEPLYQHAICSSHPSLSFVGIPWQVIPFPMMELQAKWISRLLSGKVKLPSRQEMEEHTKSFYASRSEENVPRRYSHRLGEDQWEYNAWLIDQISSGEPGLPDWRPKMHQAGRENIFKRPESYRDTFPDESLVSLAEAEGRALIGKQQGVQAVH